MRDDRPSSSAQTVAMCRAVLTSSGDVNDAYAMAMLHRGPRAAARMLRIWPFTRLARSATFTFLAARTQFFDDAVVRAVDRGIDQVVVIGAGYDSRAWRLGRPGVRFFEVDHPATQRDKRRLAPAGGPTYVAADLRSADVGELLVDAELRVDRPTTFVVEGLTMYLPEPVVRHLLDELARVGAPHSELAVNFTIKGGGSVSPVSRAVAWITRMTWMFRGEQSHRWLDAEALPEPLTAAGWSVNDVVAAPALARRHLSGSRLRLDGLNPGAICITATRDSNNE